MERTYSGCWTDSIKSLLENRVNFTRCWGINRRFRIDTKIKQLDMYRLTCNGMAFIFKGKQGVGVWSSLTYFKNFWWAPVLLWRHWYPCFGLLVTFPPGLKARLGSLIHTWWRCMWYTFPENHLWCDTCWPLDGQHGRLSLFPTYMFQQI